MKISKSKQELARIISENGGWRKGSHAAQDSVIRFFTGDKPKYNKETKLWHAGNSGLRIMAIGGAKLLQNRQRTILSRAEYFHLYPAPDAKTEFCESVMRSIPEPEAKPTIEQLAADYRNAKGYAERKQQEADDAKSDAEEKLAELVAAGEAIGLLVSPITAKPDPELVVTDWRQLKVGDLVEITTTRDGVNIGEAATIIAIDENNENFPVTVTFPEDKYPLEYSYERPPTTWRFIRRP